MASRFPLVFLLLLGLLQGAEATHDGHDHGDDGHDHGEESWPWEWAGVFTLEAGEHYVWSAERGEAGLYADPHMQLLLMATDHADSHGIEEREAAADVAWDAANIPELESGGRIPLGSAVNLHFDAESWVSTFRITVPTTGAYVFFAQHAPVEFENRFHYLKDEHGDDIEPAAETEGGGHAHGHGEEEASGTTEHDDRWPIVIFGTLATTLPSLLLVVLAGPALLKVPEEFLPTVSCFASGAILAAAVFLMLPEGYLLAGVDQTEVDATWTWGTALMSGWFFSVCVHFVGDFATDRSSKDKVEPVEPEVKTEVGNDTATAEKPPTKVVGGCSGIDWAVCFPVLFGDFFHNIVDGFVIGFAAKACSMSLVTSIIGATILHEMPQEFGDFVVLIEKGRMSWVLAAVFNFLAGLSAVVGAIIAYDSTVSAQFEGLSLAFGAGVYIFVAVTELGPAFLQVKNKSPLLAALRLLLFVVGAVLIGLVLINHEHCIATNAAGEATGAHAGHDHR
eukprot:CAMPEP_0178406214 /NCGR_PEP_ID=MMETSP0689_2-20121128/18798_1 /TAXON_ID=160604 /ORGANISM="Amphidinium massartii, Strain CS-259" /LENGTH=506 /DNA_ID=CAMNT_0020027251 /DNA_START=33 /DNA_END=1553 /DNA_ORIENTATION=-